MKPTSHSLFCGILAAIALTIAPAANSQIQTSGEPGSPGATTTIDGRHLPNAPAPFGGVINLSATNSEPYWPPKTPGGSTSRLNKSGPDYGAPDKSKHLQKIELRKFSKTQNKEVSHHEII